MKPKAILRMISIPLLLAIWIMVSAPRGYAQDVLKYACSSQVYTAFSKEFIAEFTQATGIKVDVKTASSGSAAYRLVTGNCDIASTARKIYTRYSKYGYKDFEFCKDPIAVILKKECGIDNLSENQLEDIFAGDIKNWKEVGGADLPILVIVPRRDTAAHENFRRNIMKRKDIAYDFMADTSTMVIEAVRYFPCGAVSFISGGATMHYPSLKTIKISGLSPTDEGYPYYQIFYYVTKDEPSENAKKFIDFTFSDHGSRIIRKYGMIPLPR